MGEEVHPATTLRTGWARAPPGLIGTAEPATALHAHIERGNRRAVELYRAWLARRDAPAARS